MSQEWSSQESAALLFSGSQPPPPVAVTQSSQQQDITSEEVIRRIEELSVTIIHYLDEENMPVLETYQQQHDDDGIAPPSKSITKRFNMTQCRSFTSILMVMAFCHSLLQADRTTTTREVYYFYVTHYRNQRECDLAILDAAALLQVPRNALGLKASPRGWFCGDLQLIKKDTGSIILDGRDLPTAQGAPVSGDWLKPAQARNFTFATARAECILVIEKEGVYNRLSEDRFFDDYPCILITGKGFPDLATRSMVHALHTDLNNLPVRGLADCDPFGVMVLHTYQYSERRGVDGGDRFSVPIQWVGLRPSQVEQLKNAESAASSLPQAVFQELTDLDSKRLEDHLLKEDHRWTAHGQDERRVQELEDMRDYKVELEALNWLGMDFCAQWVGDIFDYHKQLQEDGQDEGKEWMEII